MFYLIAPTAMYQKQLIKHCKENGIWAVFHYIPLHLSEMGEKLGYKSGDLPVTEEYYRRIVRIPLYCGLSLEDQNTVCETILNFVGANVNSARTVNS